MVVTDSGNVSGEGWEGAAKRVAQPLPPPAEETEGGRRQASPQPRKGMTVGRDSSY